MSTSRITIINTRPKAQANGLTIALKKQGYAVIEMPCLHIKPANTESVKKQCALLSNFDIAIFVSANAITFSMPYWPNPFPIQTILAVGKSTAECLQKQGVSQVIWPKTFNSQALLELDVLHRVEGKKIIIFSGIGTKPLLQNELTKRGATVCICESYERFQPSKNDKILNQIEQQARIIMISTSYEGLINLNQLLAKHEKLKHQPLIVISEKMSAFAESAGWKTVILAKNPSTEALLDALSRTD